MSRVIFQPKLGGSKISMPFDFTSEIANYAPAETIASAVVTCTVYSGTDANPSAMISGSASISGLIVTQDVTAGTAGVIYQLLCTAVTSGSHTLEIDGFLVVSPDLP